MNKAINTIITIILLCLYIAQFLIFYLNLNVNKYVTLSLIGAITIFKIIFDLRNDKDGKLSKKQLSIFVVTSLCIIVLLAFVL